MSDLIDRQAAIDALDKLDVSDGVGISSIACNLQKEAIRGIENLPTAEPERKTGRWIAKPLYLGSEAKIYTCSECKNPFWWDSMNYCPNCGAKMEDNDAS